MELTKGIVTQMYYLKSFFNCFEKPLTSTEFLEFWESLPGRERACYLEQQWECQEWLDAYTTKQFIESYPKE